MRLYHALFFLCAFALAACAKPAGSVATPDGEAKIPGGTSPLRLALVTGSPRDAADDAAAAGIVAAKERLGAQIQILRAKRPSEYGSDLTLLADEEYDEIFAVGARMRDAVGEIAHLYPRRRFAIVGAHVDQANVTSIAFRDQDAAFLAGALAAMMTKRGTIGFLGDVDLPARHGFEAGFSAGAREIDPKIAIVVRYVGSLDDVARAAALAERTYDHGADVLFVAAGPSGLGAIERARSLRGVFAIGTGPNQAALAPGKVLASVVERPDIAVFHVAEEAQSLKATSGTLELGLADGGVGLTDLGSARKTIGSQRLARLAALRRAIVDGRIVAPRTRAALAAFRPVPLSVR